MSAKKSRPREGAANDLAGGRIDAQPTARPRPVSLIGAVLYHSLIANGYAITGVCRACGAPLTNHKSVAAQIGPVCVKRGAVNA